MTKKNFERQILNTSKAEDLALKTRLEQVDSILLHRNDVSRTTKLSTNVVRDTFSMPPNDYSIIAQLRTRATTHGLIFTKSEIVRAGLKLLAQTSDAEFKSALKILERIPPGRKR